MQTPTCAARSIRHSRRRRRPIRRAEQIPLDALSGSTRLYIVAWLLTQRAIESGEIPDRGGRRPERRLGHAQDSDEAVVIQLPDSARKLINASAELYARVKRLDEGTVESEAPQSPARALMGRLERGLSGGGSL